MDLDGFSVVTHKKRKHSNGGDESDSSNRTIVTPAAAPPKKARIPPLVVDGIKNWQQFLKTTRSNGYPFEAKFAGDRIHLICSSVNEFRELQKYLSDIKVSFHTFSLEADREVKVTMRGIRHDTPVDDIKEALESEGFSPNSVTLLRRRDAGSQAERSPTNCFLVKLRRSGSWAKIWELRSLLGVRVSVKEFTPQKGIPQCYNCQRFGHSSVNCHLAPRCLKCAGAHLGRECEVRAAEEHPRCCNCGGPHVASWKGCPSHQNALASRRRRSVPPGRPAQGQNRPPNVRNAPPPNQSQAPGTMGPPPPPPQSSRPRPAPQHQVPLTPGVVSYSTAVRGGRAQPAPRPILSCTDTDLESEVEEYTTADTDGPYPYASNPKPRRPRRNRRPQRVREPSNAPAAAPVPIPRPRTAPVQSSLASVQLRPERAPYTAQRPVPPRASAPAPPQEPSNPPADTVSTAALLAWIASIVPVLLNPEGRSPRQILAHVLTSLQSLLSNDQTP